MNRALARWASVGEPFRGVALDRCSGPRGGIQDGVSTITGPSEQDRMTDEVDSQGDPASGVPVDSSAGEGGVAPKGSPARPSRDVPKTAAVWIATAGGLGFGPWAPGTWGALGAVLLFTPFFAGLGWLTYGALVAAVTAIGVWASTAAERDFARHDDGRIVIDEVAGQLITLWPLVPLRDVPLGVVDLSFGLATDPGFFEVSIFSLLVVTGFVAFRWFDIRKPGAVRWAERRFEAGAGVMADDVVAGIYGAVALIVPAYFVLVMTGGL